MYQRICQIVLAIAAIFFATTSFAACLKEGDNITVSGVVHSELFYGPPGWGEDREHDKKLHQWILRLDKPLSCVDEAETSQPDWNREVQLIMNNREDYITKENMLNQKVTISGNIFLAETLYHLTPVLLSEAVFITSNKN